MLRTTFGSMLVPTCPMFLSQKSTNIRKKIDLKSFMWVVLALMLERTWFELGATLDPKLALCWRPNRINISTNASQDALGSENSGWDPSRPRYWWNLGRLWSIVDRCSMDFRSFFGRIWIDFWSVLRLVFWARWRVRSFAARWICIYIYIYGLPPPNPPLHF